MLFPGTGPKEQYMSGVLGGGGAGGKLGEEPGDEGDTFFPSSDGSVVFNSFWLENSVISVEEKTCLKDSWLLLFNIFFFNTYIFQNSLYERHCVE